MVITFDLELPVNTDGTEAEQWNGTPPISEDYERARDIIREKVDRLIESFPKH